MFLLNSGRIHISVRKAISADPHNFKGLKLLFFDLLFRPKGKRRFQLDVDTNSSVMQGSQSTPEHWREHTLIAFMEPGCIE